MTFRNRKLLDLAEGKPCVMCGADDGTVVAAHSNLLEHGKGMGTKAHDGMTAWLCSHCHFRIDQGKDLNKAEKRELTLTAICRTYQKLWDQNLIEVRK
jgi:ferredoxin